MINSSTQDIKFEAKLDSGKKIVTQIADCFNPKNIFPELEPAYLKLIAKDPIEEGCVPKNIFPELEPAYIASIANDSVDPACIPRNNMY